MGKEQLKEVGARGYTCLQEIEAQAKKCEAHRNLGHLERQHEMKFFDLSVEKCDAVKKVSAIVHELETHGHTNLLKNLWTIHANREFLWAFSKNIAGETFCKACHDDRKRKLSQMTLNRLKARYGDLESPGKQSGTYATLAGEVGISKLRTACSRLYRSQILKVN